MKARYLVAIIAVLVVVFFFYKKDRPSTVTTTEEETESTEAQSAHAPQKSESSAQAVSQTAVSGDKSSAPAATNEQIEEVKKNFSAQLRQMGQCLAVQMNVGPDSVDPQYDSLANSLTSAFGNMLVKMDDWTQWEGQAGDGSIRRIRTEVEYLENNIPTKRVQLYKLNPQGMPELQPIEEDLAVNPPDEALMNMRGDAHTMVEEKASRGYYAEGEELVVVERNGKIQSFSMSKGEKTFSCTETDTVTSNCQCL